MHPPTATLDRRLGTGDAVVIGLSAMVGAGVFAAFGPAAAAAGTWLLAGLALAAVVAWARRAAALALLTAANLRGITRTALAARVLLSVTLATLLTFLVVAYGAADPSDVDWAAGGHGGLAGVLQSAGLLFFAFAGYARVATLGEEVRRPDRIGRAVVVALVLVVLLYLAVGVAVLTVLGPGGVAATATPVAEAARVAGAAWAVPVVRVGAAAASLGALLALLAGVGRTSLAMAREGDLPRWLASVDPRHLVPHHAEVAAFAVAALLVLVGDVRGAIGFSSFGVLTYYAVANLSALRQPAEDRRWPRALNVLGLAGCATLVVTLPATAVAVGVLVFADGVGGRLLRSRRRSAGPA